MFAVSRSRLDYYRLIVLFPHEKLTLLMFPELRDNDIETLGDVKFFARALSRIEMQEIMFAGFTLQSIATGKQMYRPMETPFDTAASRNSESFASASDARAETLTNIEIQGALSRQTTSNTVNPIVIVREAEIVVNDSSPCRQVAGFGIATSCHFLTLTEADIMSDNTTTGSKQFLPLIPTRHMPSGKRPEDKVWLGFKKSQEYLRYDNSKFPSWCGGSATFSFWFEPQTVGGYTLGRYQNPSEPNNDTNHYLLGAFDSRMWPFQSVSQGIVPFKDMRPGQRRHYCVTFDHLSDNICVYLDGVLVECRNYGVWRKVEGSGHVGKMDCGMDGPDSYTSLGHRIPGC